MSDSPWLQSSLQSYFGQIDDPRVKGRCDHRLVEIITIALFAVLAAFLELPNGIPSPDTFRRVLAQLGPLLLSLSKEG